jgi:hypothetical protein
MYQLCLKDIFSSIKGTEQEANVETGPRFTVTTQYSKQAQEETHSPVRPNVSAHATFCLHHWSVTKMSH